MDGRHRFVFELMPFMFAFFSTRVDLACLTIMSTFSLTFSTLENSLIFFPIMKKHIKIGIFLSGQIAADPTFKDNTKNWRHVLDKSGGYRPLVSQD